MVDCLTFVDGIRPFRWSILAVFAEEVSSKNLQIISLLRQLNEVARIRTKILKVSNHYLFVKLNRSNFESNRLKVD